ncbi:MAG TPA: FkbM family methyltransferase [Paracoccaceae bacterium]|nr:FkbM family methyltransferase [Paracoccaceae bacterium]HMO70698.1 FkbM family methyltransferase [Paracoccaceae bacterium]
MPPFWKIRREFWRAIGKIRFAILRRTGMRTALPYHGLTVPLNRTGMNAEIVRAILSHSYEDPEIRGLRRVVRPGDRVLELGSGLGVVTALAARAAAPGGQVLSFEANPGMIPETRAFLQSHGISNVEIRHAVLIPGVAPGETRDFHLASSFAVGSLLGGTGRRSREVIAVPSEDLNATVAAFAPDVLLCDIEGGEADLIPALDASGLRAVVIELHPDRLSAATLDTIRAALARHGLTADPTPGGTVEVFTRKAGP